MHFACTPPGRGAPQDRRAGASGSRFVGFWAKRRTGERTPGTELRTAPRPRGQRSAAPPRGSGLEPRRPLRENRSHARHPTGHSCQTSAPACRQQRLGRRQGRLLERGQDAARFRTSRPRRDGRSLHAAAALRKDVRAGDAPHLFREDREVQRPPLRGHEGLGRPRASRRTGPVSGDPHYLQGREGRIVERDEGVDRRRDFGGVHPSQGRVRLRRLSRKVESASTTTRSRPTAKRATAVRTSR